MNVPSPPVLFGLMLLAGAGCHNSDPVPGNKIPNGNATSPASIASRPGVSPVALADRIFPHFSEAGAAIGVEFQRYDDIRGQHRLLEANGGGVGLLDFDNDGLLDIYFTNGCRLPRSLRDDSHSNQLFRNTPAGKFLPATKPAGLTQAGYFQGCTAGDFDNDGFEDLYVAAFGDNAFWRNQGDGTFQDITRSTRTQVHRWSSSPAFADFNGDGNLDLFVVTYVEAGDDPPRLCPSPSSRDGFVQCSPTMFPASDDLLFLNDGCGGFFDATESAGVAGIDGKGLGIAVFDANRDGRPDIFIANDGTPNFLYLNQPTSAGLREGVDVPRFVDKAFELGVAVNSQGKAQAGMGVTVGDVDGDERLDLFVTNFYGEGNSFYRNLGRGGFEDEAAASGLGPPSRRLLGFGTVLFDPDNDGWPDLFVTNGHVDDLSSFRDIPYRMPPSLFVSDRGGRFIDAGSRAGRYFQENWLGRGVAVGDIDADGDQDLVVSHQLAPSAVLRNDTQSNRLSVSLRLVGTGNSNRSGLHTVVRLKGLSCPLLRESTGGGSFQSASDRAILVGLGESASLPGLDVVWADGTKETLSEIRPGRYLLIQGRGIVATTTSNQN